jgi:hypothetical protein
MDRTKLIKETVTDLIVSLGVGFGAITLGSFSDVREQAAIIGFIVFRTAVVSGAKAVLKWANS